MQVRLPSAVAEPSSSTPPRKHRSARLTCHIDIEPHAAGGLILTGAARELRTNASCHEVVASASVRARVSSARVLQELEVVPENGIDRSLVGSVVGSGFRGAVAAAFTQEPVAHGALHALLDDLPVAVLISGYAALYNGKMQVERKHLEAGLLRPDICAGWRSDGTMIVTLKDQGHLPVSLGPPAGTLEASDDVLAWHEMPPLPSGAMRRRRLVDVSLGHRVDVFAMFRDTHLDAHGVETVLHEYSLTAVVDPVKKVLHDCVAVPRVLPWPECPAAAASAGRLNGERLDDVHAVVTADLRGTSTCTHLNDLLRSLGRAASLLSHLS
jgi:Protein of unknown function (DUF2889)